VTGILTSYQMIPQPISVADYEARDPTQEVSYSSWAYVLELIRILGQSVLPLQPSPEQPDWREALDRAEVRIVNWLHRIPRWKQEALSPHGVADLMLYYGLGLVHS
jgi:hypothetical protein